MLALPLAGLGLAELVVWRLFPDPGRYPFPVAEFAAAAVFCVLGVAATWRVERARPLTWIFVVYFLACSAAFLLPSAVGENMARLRFMALPLAVLALSLRHWRPRIPAIALLALAASWNLTPLGWVVDRNVRDSAGTATYWADTSAFLHARLTPDHRVEVVDTASHWASYYLARQRLPLARGWYRQDDFPQNALLYGDLTPGRYLGWLHRLAVLYVVLPDVELDYSAQAEAKLLRSSANPLRPVERLAHVTVFEVPHARTLVSGPGQADVLALTPKTIALRLTAPGRYRVAARYSPYSASQPWLRQSHRGRCDRALEPAGRASDADARIRASPNARDPDRPGTRMSRSGLIRRLWRRSRAVLELVVVPIASGLTAALLVDAATESGRYGLWIGSAVTVAMTSLVIRIRRGG